MRLKASKPAPERMYFFQQGQQLLVEAGHSSSDSNQSWNSGTYVRSLDGSFSSFLTEFRDRQRADRFFTKQLIVCAHFFTRVRGEDLFLVGSVFTSLFDFVTKSVSLLNFAAASSS